MPCDVIVASEAAKFGMLFIKMGLVPELASTHFLVQRVGFGRASEICLSGRLIPGREAYECGLADRLVAPEALLDTALEIAGGMAANPPPQAAHDQGPAPRATPSDGDLREVQRRESTTCASAGRRPSTQRP